LFPVQGFGFRPVSGFRRNASSAREGFSFCCTVFPVPPYAFLLEMRRRRMLFCWKCAAAVCFSAGNAPPPYAFLLEMPPVLSKTRFSLKKRLILSLVHDILKNCLPLFLCRAVGTRLGPRRSGALRIQ
jgi:hypothetical protein